MTHDLPSTDPSLSRLSDLNRRNANRRTEQVRDSLIDPVVDETEGLVARAVEACVQVRRSAVVRSFVRLGLEDAAPDHSTISRTRRLIGVQPRSLPLEAVKRR